MFNIFKKKTTQDPIIEVITDVDGQKSVMIRKDTESAGKDNVELMELSSKNSNIPIFKGKIKHLYESDFTGQKDHCPLCNSQLVRMISNFPYATQNESRIITAAAGLFCPNCPTAIVDDDLMQDLVDSTRFEYHGVFAIEDGYNGTNVIESLNGEKPVFIIDEDGTIGGIYQSVHQPEGLLYIDHRNNRIIGNGIDIDIPQEHGTWSNIVPLEKVNAQRNKKNKKKARNKSAKQSKKANRKK